MTALVLVGCTGDDDPTPDPAEPTTTSATSTDEGDGSTTQPSVEAVTVTREVLGAEVEVTVHPVEVRDDTALLRTEYRVVSGELSENFGFVLKGGGVDNTAGAGGLRLVDAEERVVYPVALDDRGRAVATYGPMKLSNDEPLEAESVHAAPEAGTVDVLVPYLGYIADVPVIDAGDGFTAIVTDLGEPAELVTYPVSSFTVSYDDVSSTQASGDEVVVTLSSGVLFAVDDAALSADAQGIVDGAAGQITAGSDGGEVRVVGHTDDVASDEYNQDLSERRAQSVADRLSAALGDGFTVVAEGRGESEPAVAGTSEEARSANRRVEIFFEGTSVVEGEKGEEVPSADVPTASGLDPVELDGTGGSAFAVSVDSVTRAGTVLAGTLRVERTEGSANPVIGLFGDAAIGRAADRKFALSELGAGPHNATVMGADSWIYPLDYTTGDRNRLLGEELLGTGPAAGEAILVTVVWPDPGTDTVTIDVPGQFRITDVPVTEG
ncbi:MAG: OmpA family protein [Cellulomonadaceae bacterium]